MNKLIFIAILAIVGVGGYLLLSGGKNSNEITQALPKQPVLEVATVIYENGRFTPSETKVKVGDAVRFENKSATVIRVSSDPHPIHTSFPEFESGRLEAGDSYQFTFTENKTVNYHDHLHPSVTGMIIVE